VEIKYTTDGSNPENNGGIYEEPFAIPEGTKFVQAIAVHEELGVLSEPITIPITDQHIEVIKDQPLTLTKYLESSTTSETYETLEKLAKHKADISGVNFDIYEQSSSMDQHWVSLSFDSYSYHKVEDILKQINQLRDTFFKEKAIDLTLNIQKCLFETGQHFEDWIADNKLSLETFKNDISQ